jgi:hypothetical protein
MEKYLNAAKYIAHFALAGGFIGKKEMELKSFYSGS